MISGIKSYDKHGNDITPMCVEADGVRCTRMDEIERLRLENYKLKTQLELIKRFCQQNMGEDNSPPNDI